MACEEFFPNITFLHASTDWNRHIIKWDQVSNRRCLNSAQTTTAHSTGQSKAWTYVHSCTWTNKNLQPLFHYSDIFPSHMLQSDAGHWCEVTRLFSEWGKTERKARRMAWPTNLQHRNVSRNLIHQSKSLQNQTDKWTHMHWKRMT